MLFPEHAAKGRSKLSGMKTRYEALTLDNWDDLEKLFGERGGCGGCWCMAWRRKSKAFRAGLGASNKRALRALVEAGRPTGILLYKDEEPVGWCSIAPREEFVRLKGSRVWAPVDDKPVWSVSCFFVAKPYRNHGVSVELLKAAAAFAKKNGARIVEGYPLDLKGKRLPDAFVWTGLLGTYKDAGFAEAARRSERKPIMRKIVR